jgi:hypothetical protein
MLRLKVLNLKSSGIGWCVILMEELEGLISQGVFWDWD